MFNEFLSQVVNLPQGKLDDLDASVDAVYTALRNDAQLPVTVLDKIPQGSWAHKTIINPRKQDAEFDADFILELAERPDWDDDPRAYRRAVRNALDRIYPYSRMPTESKCRCVRVTYQAQFHLDIVPFVRRGGRGWIVNGDDNEWEPADPTGFTTWFNDKNRITDGHLRRVLRILKYVRDGSDWAGTRSVLLMILVGERVDAAKALAEPGYYGDIPTALVHLLEDLNTFLQSLPGMPAMPDPARSGTDFDHRWGPETFERLRDRVQRYAAQARAALDENDDPSRSRALWREVLGDQFDPIARRPARTGPFGPVPPTPGRSGRAG